MIAAAGSLPLDGLDSAGAVRGFEDLIPRVLQYQAQTVADIRLVFDDEDTTRAAQPVWSRNGRERFCLSWNKLMVVDVTAGSTFSAGKPQMLFEGPYFTTDFPTMTVSYDASADGQRFLVVKRAIKLPHKSTRSRTGFPT